MRRPRLLLVLPAALLLPLCATRAAEARTVSIERSAKCPDVFPESVRAALETLPGWLVSEEPKRRGGDGQLLLVNHEVRRGARVVWVRMENTSRRLTIRSKFEQGEVTEDEIRRDMEQVYGLLRGSVPDLPDWHSLGEAEPGGRWDRPAGGSGGSWWESDDSDDAGPNVGVIGVLVFLGILFAIALVVRLLNQRDDRRALRAGDREAARKRRVRDERWARTGLGPDKYADGPSGGGPPPPPPLPSAPDPGVTDGPE